MFDSIFIFLKQHPFYCLWLCTMLIVLWLFARYNRTKRLAHLPALMAELQRFHSEPVTRIMDDFFTYKNVLAEFTAGTEVHRIAINAQSIRWMLRPATVSEVFTPAEIVFRRSFGDYLAGVSAIAYYYEQGVADKILVRQYLGRFIDLAGKRRTGELPLQTVQAIQNYLIENRQNSVIRLLSRYGHLCRLNTAAAEYESARPATT